MKKIMILCLLITFVFAFQMHAIEIQKLNKVDKPTSKILTGDDVFPTTNPLVEQIIQARDNGDMVLYNQLLEEYKMQLPAQPNNLPEVIQVKNGPGPFMRWGNDVMIYNGNVAYNSWAVVGNIDDEAISVDYYKGDTLRAAIAGADSVLWIYRSDDAGMGWYYEHGFYLPNSAVYEPEIINGPGGYLHVFCRFSAGNGNIYVQSYDPSGGVASSYWIESSDDTVRNYTVCSDRTDWYSAYYLYLMYHKGLGGVGADELWFTRSLDKGATWDTPAALQGNGSGFADISYGNSGYLYQTRIWQQTGGDKVIRTRVSTNYGVSWLGSQTVYSDTSTKMGPQIACSHDGTGDVWVIFPKRDPGTTNNDYGNLWSWSQDNGATWSSVAYVNSWVGYNEVLPSISVHDGYHDSLYYPYVTFIRSVDDWSDPAVCSFNWQTDSTWSPDTSYNDTIPALTRPIQTWQAPGVPAMAYVGSGGTNVYYDSWSNTQVEEEKTPVTRKEIISNACPNPFRHMTRINYSLPNRGTVTVEAFNLLGQKVATIFDGVKESGDHTIEWYGVDNTGKRLPRGIYFLQIKTANITSSKKLILQ